MIERKALVVGINTYPDNPLRNCVNDAEEIAGVLEMPEYGFKVTTLLDQNATRRTMLSELQSLFSGTPDFVVFYFAGHGIVNEFSTFLATIDTDPIDVGVDLDFLRRLANSRLAEDTTGIILLDCCHSGTAHVRRFPGSNARSFLPGDIDRALALPGAGKVVIAACQPHELSYEEPSLQHGAFTYYLLEGLYGDAADSEGKVTVPSLYDYVSQRFTGVTRQIPVFRGDIVGRIILGEGLTPRDRKEVPEHKAREIDVMACRLMDEYIQLTSTDTETWKSATHRDACSLLLPRWTWFNTQIAQSPPLAMRPRFRSAFETAHNKLAELGHLMEGLNTRFGTVTNKIGAGTFGTVWKIRTEDGKDLAYKVYHPIDMDNAEKLRRFGRGFRAMQLLDHPHIVKVQVFTDCPIGFIMDFISGPNLRDFASDERDPNEIVLQLLTVGETLKHAHGREVVHRDVKPENIIMSWDGGKEQYKPYLTDFDLAWFSTATQFTREGFGSHIYASPEQQGKPNSTIAHAKTTDVYAFGQLCYFFICRRDPVPMSDNVRALEDEVRHWPLVEAASMMVSLYDKCTAQKPADRVQDFREICDQLYTISQLLAHADHEMTISSKDFVRQLMFSVVGLASERIASDRTFYSTSGQVMINVDIKELYRTPGQATEVIFQMQFQREPAIQGIGSFQKAREAINQKIDTALREFPQIRRHPGGKMPFETKIHVPNVRLNIDGVELCRQVLMRCVDCIESS